MTLTMIGLISNFGKILLFFFHNLMTKVLKPYFSPKIRYIANLRQTLFLSQVVMIENNHLL